MIISSKVLKITCLKARGINGKICEIRKILLTFYQESCKHLHVLDYLNSQKQLIYFNKFFLLKMTVSAILSEKSCKSLGIFRGCLYESWGGIKNEIGHFLSRLSIFESGQYKWTWCFDFCPAFLNMKWHRLFHNFSSW